MHNSEPIAPVLPDIHLREMLFSLGHIRERFGDLLQTWFSRQKQITPLYDLYFATVRSPRMYVEHRFLNMFQALESYDRRTYVHPPEKMQAHQERLERILDAVHTAYKKWLEGCLRHSHEPAAADRIRRLMDMFDARWLFVDPSKDIQLAADLRNFYTHFDRHVEARLPLEEERPRCMHNLAVRLQLLCELALLHEAGFSKQEARQQMEATRRLERRLVR